jgi:hypothetical protein
LTAGFCEIRLARPVPVKASGGIDIKKYPSEIRRESPPPPSRDARQTLFGGEFHNEGAPKAESYEREA